MTTFAATHGLAGCRTGGWAFMTGRGRRRRDPMFWGGPGMRGFFGPSGPRAGRGDIRAAILALLREGPMHGYQIMRELTERSGGVWRPSPGSVYPTLQQLQDEGLVRGAEDEGGRRTVELTDDGRTAAESLGKAPWETLADETESEALELRDLVFQVIVAARQVAHAGDESHLTRAKDVLREARQRLYRILADDAGDEAADTTPRG